MSRSIWKGIFIPKELYINYYLNREIGFYLKKGNITFISNFVTFTFFMYTGKKFIEFIVDITHVGFRLGHFIFTRKMGFIHKTAKKKKKNKLKKKNN